jgi:5,10-methylene-tetrahydrofolate dehydrogenase/methenyl tetrahydrofolate cyclohydrolase
MLSVQINGNLIKEYVKSQCRDYQKNLEGKEISIIRFPSPLDVSSDALRKKYAAALVSENQKVATFQSLGVNVNRITLSPEETTIEEFQNILQMVNNTNKISAAIVQFPIPQEYLSSIQLLSPKKDIDVIRGIGSNLFQVPATAEGICRLVESYTEDNSNVAVIGGRGFIGSGIINYLIQRNINCSVLEKGDDLSETRNADIVISVTGIAGLATPYILPSHKLVVDGGFIPSDDPAELPTGDIDRSAYSIPQNIAPVPGGVGPIEMAILAERFVKMELNVDIPQWNYQVIEQEQRMIAQAIAPINNEGII